MKLKAMYDCMHEEILNFIKRRWQKDSDWCSGNCWWFASILIERFAKYRLRRYYFPIEGHFAAGDGKHYYDWKGEYISPNVCYEWEDICNSDPLWASHLVRDCWR